MRFVLAILAAFSLASPSLAEEYEKGPNGGLMLDVAGIDAELLTSGNTVTINVFEPFKPKSPSINNSVKSVFGESFFAAMKPCSSSRREKNGGSG
jgi:hypothetical protein